MEEDLTPTLQRTAGAAAEGHSRWAAAETVSLSHKRDVMKKICVAVNHGVLFSAIAVLLTLVESACGGLGGVPAGARRKANEYWEGMFSKCGDSLYTEISVLGLTEWKDAQITVSKQNLGETDRLNGYEWNGTTTVSTKHYRYWRKDYRVWSDWQGELMAFAQVWKKNGEWYISGPPRLGGGDANWNTYQKVPCELVPGD